MAFKKRPRSKEDIDAMIALEQGSWARTEPLKRSEVEKMSVEELFTKYVEIEGNNVRNKFDQCVVIREIRLKYGEDDRRFGEYLATTILSEILPHTITRMVRVAEFFENRPIDGIMWSSALALSEPRNAPVALEVYNEFAGKMARPIDVTRRIEEMIGRQLPSDSITLHIEPPSSPAVSQEDLERMADAILKDFSFMSKSNRLRLWRALIRKEEN